MGEESKLPNKNIPNGNVKNDEEMDVNDDAEEEEVAEESDVEQFTEEEYKTLDNQLNALNEALDNVEQKNDNIFAQLQQLLQSNREIRNQIEKEAKD